MNDVTAKLRERFDECVYWYQSAWEHDPNMEIINNTITGRDSEDTAHETQMIELFENLRDSVNAISPRILAETDALRASLSDDKFEAVFERAVEGVGRQSFPKSATEFLQTLNPSLQFAT